MAVRGRKSRTSQERGRGGATHVNKRKNTRAERAERERKAREEEARRKEKEREEQRRKEEEAKSKDKKEKKEKGSKKKKGLAATLLGGLGVGLKKLWDLLSNGGEEEQAPEQGDRTAESQLPSGSQIPTLPNIESDGSGKKQLELDKNKAGLTAQQATKTAQASKAALGSYNQAESLVSHALDDLQASGVVVSKINESIPEVTAHPDKPAKLPTEVQKETEKVGGLGVVGLQHLFGKIDGVKDSVVQVGQMLYAAQDIQIRQNNAQIEQLQELQRIIKDQGTIEGADSQADITEKKLEVAKDQIEADTARKIKSAADKAYEEATNANAEAKEAQAEVRAAGTDRIAAIRNKVANSVKPNNHAKAALAAFGIAALIGGVKKFLTDDDEDDEEVDEEVTTEEGTPTDENAPEISSEPVELDKQTDQYQFDEKGFSKFDKNGQLLPQGQVRDLDDEVFEVLPDGKYKHLKTGTITGVVQDEETGEWGYDTPLMSPWLRMLTGASDNAMEGAYYGMLGASAYEGGKGLYNWLRPAEEVRVPMAPTTPKPQAHTPSTPNRTPAHTPEVHTPNRPRTGQRMMNGVGGALSGVGLYNSIQDGDVAGTAIFGADIYNHTVGNRLQSIIRSSGQNVAEDVSESAVKQMNKELGELIAKRTSGELTKKAAAKGATKVFGKFATKITGGKIPGVGLAMSAYFANEMLNEGDYIGAGIEALSGIASCIPVAGTVVSGILDGVQLLYQLGRGLFTSDPVPVDPRVLLAQAQIRDSYLRADSQQRSQFGNVMAIESTGFVFDKYRNLPATDQIQALVNHNAEVEERNRQRRAHQAEWSAKIIQEQSQLGQMTRLHFNDIPDWYRAEYAATQRTIQANQPQFRAAPRYAEGGIVPGNPADGDSVPAILQPGEFVMPVDLVQRLSSALEAGGTDASDGPVRGSKPITPRQVTVHHPTIPSTRRTMLRPSEQPAQVPQTSINPKDFENAVHNENFDIVSAVGAISELPSYDLAEGEDSNKTKDPTEASIQGICARYVRSALEAGGINAQSHPGEAYEYAKWLPKQGFNVIDNNSMLLPGDISVEGKTDMNPHGHIAMWNGVQWVSDRLQNSRLVTPPGMHGELTLLRHHSMPETKVSENTDYGKADFDYGADNNVGASLFDMRDMLSGMPANYQSLIASSPANQKAFVQNIRSMLIKSMETKQFVKPEDVKLYADVMTAQVAQETGWGQHIPAGGRSNNWSGMTRGTAILHGRGGTGMIHSSGTGDYNDYAVFDSIDDWADEYVEYLHRKWKAFDRGPENFLNQLEYSTINPGQRYGGRTPDAYISAVTGCLPRVRAIAYENGEVASLGPGSGSQVGVNWWTNFMNSYNGLRYGTGLQGEIPGFDGEYGPRGLWKPTTSNPDDGRYSPNRGSQDKQVSVGPPNNFPTNGTVTLDYRIQGNEQGNGGQGTYGQLFVNGKYFSDAHRTLANGAQYNVGRTVPIWWNPSGKIIGTRASSDNWRSYRDNYIREKYGDQAVRQGRMPGMNEGSGTGGNRIHAGADSSWSEGCLVVGYDDKNGTHKMNTTDSYATWWSLYQGLDTLDKQGGRAQLKMTDMRGGGNAPMRNEPAQPWRATWGDAGDEPKDTVVKTSDIPENEAAEATVASPIANMMPRATANFDRTQFSSPHLPIPEMPEEPEGSEVTKKEKESPQVTTPIVYAPQTHNQGGNTTVNNHTEVHNHIHTDSAADAELR